MSPEIDTIDRMISPEAVIQLRTLQADATTHEFFQLLHVTHGRGGATVFGAVQRAGMLMTQSGMVNSMVAPDRARLLISQGSLPMITLLYNGFASYDDRSFMRNSVPGELLDADPPLNSYEKGLLCVEQARQAWMNVADPVYGSLYNQWERDLCRGGFYERKCFRMGAGFIIHVAVQAKNLRARNQFNAIVDQGDAVNWDHAIQEELRDIS